MPNDDVAVVGAATDLDGLVGTHRALGSIDVALDKWYELRTMSGQQEIDQLNRAIHALLLRLNVARLDLWSDKLSGVGYLDLHAMSFIEEKPEHSIAEMREFLQVPQSTLTSLISRLEQRGAVRRQVHPTDKRSYRIELTRLGEEIQREHHRVERLIMKRILAALPDPSERSEFVRLFLRVASSV